MVLIAGWGDKGRVIGQTEIALCEHCNNSNPFNVVEQTKRVTAFFIPVIKWDYRYFVACPVCNYGLELRNKEAALELVANSLGTSRRVIEEE